MAPAPRLVTVIVGAASSAKLITLLEGHVAIAVPFLEAIEHVAGLYLQII